MPVAGSRTRARTPARHKPWIPCVSSQSRSPPKTSGCCGRATSVSRTRLAQAIDGARILELESGIGRHRPGVRADRRPGRRDRRGGPLARLRPRRPRRLAARGRASHRRDVRGRPAVRAGRSDRHGPVDARSSRPRRSTTSSASATSTRSRSSRSSSWRPAALTSTSASSGRTCRCCRSRSARSSTRRSTRIARSSSTRSSSS